MNEIAPVTVKARALGSALVATIPKVFRDELNIGRGDRVRWRLHPAGDRLILRTANGSTERRAVAAVERAPEPEKKGKRPRKAMRTHTSPPPMAPPKHARVSLPMRALKKKKRAK